MACPVETGYDTRVGWLVPNACANRTASATTDTTVSLKNGAHYWLPAHVAMLALREPAPVCHGAPTGKGYLVSRRRSSLLVDVVFTAAGLTHAAKEQPPLTMSVAANATDYAVGDPSREGDRACFHHD